MGTVSTHLRALPRSFLGAMVVWAMAANVQAAATEEQMDRLVGQTVKADGPGCAILVVDEGKIVFERAYGIADMDTGRPINTATAFNIESVTKQFTAACIALLAEEGKMSLDDDIRKYLPEMPAYEAPIQIKHLIFHTSGIRDLAVLSFLQGYPVDETPSESVLLDLLARQKELNFRPGETHRYSNSGYFLLGLVVQRVTGMSVGAYAERHLFDPLGMMRTSYHRDPERIGENVAIGHAALGEGKYRRTHVAPDTRNFGFGGLYTTVEDLYRWDQSFIRNQIGGESFNTLRLTCGTLNNGDPLTYAFGLRIGTHRGCRTVGHQGGSPSYNAFFMRFPDHKFTVICLANYALNTTRLSYEIADLYLELPNEKPAHPPAPVTYPVAKVDPAIYASFAGKYCVNDGAVMPITTQDNRLYVQPPGAPLLELFPKSTTEYFLKVVNVQVSFFPLESGKATRLIWHQNGHHIPAERLDDRPLRPGQLNEYEGEYYSEELQIAYGVYVREDQLYLKAPRVPGVFQRNFRDPPGKNVLRHLGGDRFVRSYGMVEFSRDDNGKIAGFALHAGPDFKNIRFWKQ